MTESHVPLKQREKNIYLPFSRVGHNGSGFLQSFPDDNFAIGAIKVGHLNATGSRICPEELVMDPVHCQTA